MKSKTIVKKEELSNDLELEAPKKGVIAPNNSPIVENPIIEPPKRKQSKNYVYTEARKLAVQKMLTAKKENAIKRNKELDELKALERDELEQKILLKSKIIKEKQKQNQKKILNLSDTEEIEIVRKPKKKIIYFSDSDDSIEPVYLPKPQLSRKKIDESPPVYVKPTHNISFF